MSSSKPDTLDFRVYVTFPRSRKTRALRQRLGSDAVLSLLQLWAFARAERPTGVLKGLSAEAIAAESDWSGDAREYVEALVEVGFLDTLEDGTYALHNWKVRQPYSSSSPKRQAHARKAAQARWARRDAPSTPEQSAEHQGAVHGASSSNAPSYPSDPSTPTRGERARLSAARAPSPPAPPPEVASAEKPDPPHLEGLVNERGTRMTPEQEEARIVELRSQMRVILGEDAPSPSDQDGPRRGSGSLPRPGREDNPEPHAQRARALHEKSAPVKESQHE